ncbi:MAG TPA: OmpA family protein [Flavobacterium sp.]|jgi:outer membrane protein OmpA-like peptidoglycan-associated protein
MRKLLLLLGMMLFSCCTFAQHKFEVYFGFNSDQPTIESHTELQKWIQQHPEVEVSALSGYADSVDANSYNKQLSQKRIQTVRALLLQSKIRISEGVVVKPYGENFKLSADQSKNRKVTIGYVSGTEGRLEAGRDSIVENLAEMFKGKGQGDIIRIRNIHFYRNKEEVIPESEPILQQLYEVMVANPRLTIEIHGHICCNPNIYDTRLSYRRAKYIFTYLLDKGVPLNRLAYMGFGSADPIYPIPEQTHAQQVANRRVEILIVRN